MATTLNTEENGEMRVATDLSLGYVILISLYLAGYVTISFKLNLFILRYLNTKPLGLQSLMDIPNKYLFRVAVIINYHICLHACNHGIHGWSWRLLHEDIDVGSVGYWSDATERISSNAIIQLILIGNPTLELPFSDSVTNIIYHSIQNYTLVHDQSNWKSQWLPWPQLLQI